MGSPDRHQMKKEKKIDCVMIKDTNSSNILNYDYLLSTQLPVKVT